ncbi:MAG TPA: hypothetical protein VFC00_23935 [Micromonosporaceae bacterium]|nr:hypothetical protein [Micromonosporaceae bacterium]
MQRLDLLLQRRALGGQAADHVVVPFLRLAFELLGPGMGLLASGFGPRPRVGHHLLGVGPGLFGVGLRVPDDLLGRGPGIRQRLAGLAPRVVGVGLGVPDDLLRHGPCLAADLVALTPGGGDMVVGGPLGEDQHLQRLSLSVGFARHGWRRRRRRRWLVHEVVVPGRPPEQPSDPALHPIIGHRTTSLATLVSGGMVPSSGTSGRGLGSVFRIPKA